MGLSPLCRSDSQKAKSAWAVQIVGNKTGRGYRKFTAQKTRGESVCSATGLFPVVL